MDDYEEVYQDQEEQVIEEKLEQLQLQFEQNHSSSKYGRPNIQKEDFSLDTDIYIMQIDCDYYMSRKQQDKTQQQQQLNAKESQDINEKPVIRIFGTNQRGNSVLVHVFDFISYFYIEVPNQFQINPENIEILKIELNKRANQVKTVKENTAIMKIEVVKKESVLHFKGKGDCKLNFFKIYTYVPSYVATLRGIFEKGINIREWQFSTRTFESNMPYALRFMIDNNIVGMGWIKINAGKFTIREDNKKISRCQIELEVSYKDIQGMKTEGEWSQIAPLRILSFDIECSAQAGFPTPNQHPIIQIASVVKVHSEDQDLARLVLTLKGCNSIPGADVKSFEKEEELLLEWQKFVQDSDPDIFLGYNITNFDFPYILNRAIHLKVVDSNKKQYGYLGKIANMPTRLKDGKYLSKAMGMRETKEMNIEGRIQLDMLMHMHREQKLSSYTLNSVSSKFLKEQKEDVHHSMIHKLQNQNNESRKRLAVYCLKDAQLPLKLMEKLMCLYNYTEMSRVTGVPLNFLFTRGQQIKVASQLYRKAAQCDMLIPTMHSGKSEGKYEGAYVLDPKTNFYEIPIATLDFASLYPSIMMAHNLCYASLIKNPDVLKTLTPDEYTRTPHGDIFVKSSIRKGLLPQILEELILARKNAKNELAKETDPMKKAVLDGRQLALKISANSVYGFTGAQVGQLPCLEISSSVTAFGRQMIDFTKNFVLKHYCKQNGFEHDSDVVYGDTDSVMVKFGVQTVDEAMKLGREAAELISKQFIKPIKLEFEKVYFPYLLMSKKRYAGVYWTKPDKYDKVDTKGIENVRRDNCAIIRQLINKVLEKVLVERDKPGAIEMIKNTISDLLQNKIDISLLVITKALTKSTGDDDDDEDDNKESNNNNNANHTNTNNNNGNKQNYGNNYNHSQAGNKNNNKENEQPKNQYKSKQAHSELAERMKKRDEGSAPHIGDRIPYVIIAGAKGSKNYENSEDPIEVLDKDLPLDFDYYIEKQLKPPLMRIFEHVIPNPQSLFVGEHTKIRYMPKVQNSAMGKFYKTQLTCLNCRGPVENDNAICERCKGKSIDVYLNKVFDNNLQQCEFADIWTQCQRCQGSLHYDVICSNRDCPIFYKRKKLQKDIEQGIIVLKRFHNDW